MTAFQIMLLVGLYLILFAVLVPFAYRSAKEDAEATAAVVVLAVTTVVLFTAAVISEINKQKEEKDDA